MSTEADSFITALQSSLTGHKEKLRVFRSTVTGITSGLIAFQRGDDTVANDAGSPRLLFRAPVVGDDIAAIDLGGAPLILGVIGGATFEDDPSDIRTAGSLTATNASTSTYTSLFSELFTLPPGTWTLACGIVANFSNSVSGSGATIRFASPVTSAATNADTATANDLFAMNFASTFTGLSGTVTVAGEYRAHTSGTVSAGRYTLTVLAKRTA
jgi:hypothetical protein